MALDFDEVFGKMMDAAADAFEDGWDSVKDYAPAEFKKMATQLVDITENVARYENDNTKGYSPETGKVLLQMQRNATESVLVAVSTLTLIAVQKAINTILQVLKDTFQAAIGAVL
jgi:hypothetical protein